MKKKILPIALILGTASILVGCGTKTIYQEGVDRTVEVLPESIGLDSGAYNLFIGDSVTIAPRFSPAKASSSEFTVTSSNEAVVSVDGKTVKAIEAGAATLTIAATKKADVKIEVPVRVSKKISRNSTLDNAIAATLSYQQEKYPELTEDNPYVVDKVDQYEVRDIKLFKNGVLQNSTTEFSRMIASLEEGFFSVEGVDYETRVEGGSQIATPYSWIFRCDSDYNTHLYHISGTDKNRLTVPTQSFLGQSRAEAVMSILDSVFTSGRNIMKNAYANAFSVAELKDYTTYRSLVTYGGVGTDSVTFNLTQNGYKTTADYDDESGIYIPVGTKYTQDYSETIYWEDGVSKIIDLKMKISYTLGEDNYERVYRIHYTTNVDNVQIELPVDREFKIVSDIFEL